MKIDAKGLHFSELNQAIRHAGQEVTVEGCLGQRFIASGQSGTDVTIFGTPGNALGAYLNGCTLNVFGNAQEATGDTMNSGRIIIHGNTGDAAGYAMRGGEIYVRGDAGYRAGIHMKEYEQQIPVLVIGGRAGSFLGEYQAGGIIIVLALDGGPAAGNFCAAGMHGGRIYLRADRPPLGLPRQVSARPATREDLERIAAYIHEFAQAFGADEAAIMASSFQVLTPDTKNPYHRMYTPN